MLSTSSEGSFHYFVVTSFCTIYVLTSTVTGGQISSLQYQPALPNRDYNENLSLSDDVLEKSYHGLIRENETLVEITPLITVDEEKICNFRILKKPYHENPFQIELVNNLGILKTKRTLNCEKRKSYHFEIIAIFCDGTHSTASNVHITVIDINEYAPTFLQPSYVVEVDEGRLYKEILRVKAIDKDCTPLFGDVCKYEILNNEQPFTIDNEGSIKNIEPLFHKASHNHILSVIAYDCAMKESNPIMVSIKIRRVCEARFLGIPERIDYTTFITENLSLFPNARLELCDMCCKNQCLNIHTSITLKTQHISFGCDRNVIHCSTGISFVDLLSRDAEWTKDLSYDEGTEQVFHFDGSSGAIVPDAVVASHDFSTHPFSIVTVFRHVSLVISNKHVKEHIVCSADNHKMNRHHMALFVRNCRLILLLRKSSNDGELTIFSPAEWRWKIPQVCDNEWHHYVLNIDQTSKVELFIDGVRFESSIEDPHSNPEVIDDWPLHAAHGINTTLTVGACYQSSESQLRHAFNGDISEVKISLDGILSSEYIKCGTNCAEHLLPPPENYLEADSQLQTNAQLSEIYIEGQNKGSIEQLLQRIQYINTKKNPTIGRRNIELRTTMICSNQSVIRLPTVETYIMVNEPSPLITTTVNSGIRSIQKNMQRSSVATTGGMTSAPPTQLLSASGDHASNLVDQTIMETVSHNNNQQQKTLRYRTEKIKIIITGDSNKLVSYSEIKCGVHILGNINISISPTAGETLSSLQSLDTCSVVVFPSLNPDHEDIQIDGDEKISSTLDIKTNINKDGVEMIGNDGVANYFDVLKALVYSNKKPAYYLNRVFKLSCSQWNSQFQTTEFILTLTVLHPEQSLSKSTTAPLTTLDVTAIALSESDTKIYSHGLIHFHDLKEPKSRIHEIVHKAESAHHTLLIILICAFLVILLCGVSVARLKNNNKKYADRPQPCQKIADESLVWDDSALTITINPIQSDVVSEDSSYSEDSEVDDEEVAEERTANVSQLEWDNSNIFSSMAD